ncbi:MAG: hypothetical protein U0324_28610 [Polyangiales bacterium]
MTTSPAPRRLALPLLPLVAAFAGCATTFLHGQAGGVVGTSGTVGGAIEGAYGRGFGGIGIEVSARAKFTPDVISGALGAGLFAAGGGRFGGPMIYGHLGAHALQLDVIDQTPYVSAFSPYLTGGVGFCVDGCARPTDSNTLLGVTTSSHEQTFITVGLAAEYDVRFVRSGEGFFGLMVGYGFREQQETHLPF